MKKFFQSIISLIITISIMLSTVLIAFSYGDNVPTEKSSDLNIFVESVSGDHSLSDKVPVKVTVKNNGSKSLSGIKVNMLYNETRLKCDQGDSIEINLNSGSSKTVQFDISYTERSLIEKVVLYALRFYRIFKRYILAERSSTVSQELCIGGINYLLVFYITQDNSENDNYDSNREYNFSFIDFYSDKFDVLVGKTDSVTFFAEIRSERIIPDDGILVYDSNDKLITTLRDDGINGDDIAGDGLFSGKAVVSSNEQRIEKYYAKYGDNKSKESEISYYPDLTKEQLSAGDPILENMYSIAKKYKLTGNSESDKNTILASYNEITDYLTKCKNDSRIIDYSFDESGFTFITYGNIHYYFAIENLVCNFYEFDDIDSENFILKSNSSKKTYEQSLNIESISETCVTSSPYTIESEFKVAAMVPNYTAESGHGCGNFSELYNVILNSNLEAEYFQFIDENVTLDTYTELDDYRLIFYAGHASKTALGTGQPTGDEYNEKYMEDLVAERIYKSGNYYVQPSFFDVHYRANSFDNTLFFIGGCNVGNNEKLMNVLFDKGVRSIVASDTTVKIGYVCPFGNELFKQMALLNLTTDSYTTLSEALDSTKDIIGKDSQHTANELYGIFYDIFRIISIDTITNSDYFKPGEFFIYGYEDYTLSQSYVKGSVYDANTIDKEANERILNKGYVDLVGYCTLGSAVKGGNISAIVPSGEFDTVVSCYGYLDRCIRNVSYESGSTTYLSDSWMVPAYLNGRYGTEGTVKDSTSQNVIAGATVNLRPDHNNKYGEEILMSTKTDENGNYSFNNLAAGYYTVQIVADGYIHQFQDIVVGVDHKYEIPISGTISVDTYRVVLTWNYNPQDLDSHLFADTSLENYHVYYVDQEGYNIQNIVAATLDVDDTNGYGPETTTFRVTNNGSYEFYVDWFDGSGTWASCGGKVEVYRGSRLVGTYYAPTVYNQNGSWRVFSINNSVYHAYNDIVDDVYVSQ